MGVRYCAGEIVWHNIYPSIVAGFYLVRVPGIVRVIFRDTYPHYIGPPTVIIKIKIKSPYYPVLLSKAIHTPRRANEVPTPATTEVFNSTSCHFFFLDDGGSLAKP